MIARPIFKPDPAPAPMRIRHIKRGSTYRVIGEGRLQWSAEAAHHPWIESTPMTVYQCEQTGMIWIRPTHEINDPARFQRLGGIKL
jgi:hypothetical protein